MFKWTQVFILTVLSSSVSLNMVLAQADNIPFEGNLSTDSQPISPQMNNGFQVQNPSMGGQQMDRGNLNQYIQQQQSRHPSRTDFSASPQTQAYNPYGQEALRGVSEGAPSYKRQQAVNQWGQEQYEQQRMQRNQQLFQRVDQNGQGNQRNQQKIQSEGTRFHNVQPQ